MFYFLTQSDEFENAWMSARGRSRDADVTARFPAAGSQHQPEYFHAGGCQVIGDILHSVRSAGQQARFVCFFAVSDPANIVEIPQLRVFNDVRDAGCRHHQCHARRS